MISVPPQGAGGGGSNANHHAGLTIGKYCSVVGAALRLSVR